MTQFKEIPATKRSLALRRLVCGVGINDADYMVQPYVNGKQVLCPYYSLWLSMIKRCYSEKCLESRPTYIGCSVIKEWLTFSLFKSWVITQDWQGKQLDKDILVAGNKIYSPKTCVFVSGEINRLLNRCEKIRGRLPQGVSFDERKKRYYSQCNVKGVVTHIGRFKTPAEAEIAYLKFKSSLIDSIAATQTVVIKDALMRHSQVMKDRITLLS